MIQGIERVLKAAIVDKTPSVSSAALVSSYHLCNVAKDIIKRWSNEVQEAINIKPASSGFASAASSYFTAGGGHSSSQSQIVISTSSINQYHAISLLFLIRQHDRMAITKLVQTYSSGKSSGGGFLGGGGGSSNVLKNPSAVCMLIRFACKVMEDDPG